MKTKTLSILFALVMVLSLSAGVFAQDFTETWNEETVLTVFSDLDIVFPDLFADIDSDFLFVESDSTSTIPTFASELPADYENTDEFAAKALAETTGTLTASYYPCGDGLVKFDLTVTKMADPEDGTYYGPENTFYIRSLTATVKGNTADVKKCTSSGGDNCRSVTFNKKGEAHITGYLYVPEVMDASWEDAPVEMEVEYSQYMTALWTVPVFDTIKGSGELKKDAKIDYCQDSLEEYGLGGQPSVRAKYDPNTGEARFQATIRNFQSTDAVNYAIPAEVLIDGIRYTDYTCKYTVYNVANAAPRTDYCKFGEGVAIAPNAAIRFDITLDHIASSTLIAADGGDIDFTFRVGGMTDLIEGAFSAVEYPCPVVTRISVMDPLKPFMTFYGMETDEPISASGPYGVYDGGLWGLYQKCGKYAYMAVRLQNDGITDETIYLDHVAVAVNGGTPMSWKWVLASQPESEDGQIELEPGQNVVLIGRAKVTDYGYQMNSDLAITGAVNFLDYGFYIQGKVYSDHNNTNCTVAP